MGRRRRAAKGVDKISSLPDAILSCILSLIPTKEAVATSILSKRWTHLWKYVDSIDFPGVVKVNDVDSNHKFNEFVDFVLVSRDTAGSHFIKTFRLDIVYIDTHLAFLSFPNITKWVNLVVQRGLQRLYLHLHAINRNDDDDDDDDDDHEEDEEDKDPKLPISILTCRTLVSLDLLGFRMEGFSFSSIGFGFPSLKTLNLMFIVFPEDRDFMLLLAGCPNLEHLRADLEIHSMLTYSATGSLTLHQEFKSLSLPKLISADITQCECYFPLKALSNSKHLCINPIQLYTLGLKFLQGDPQQHPYDKIPTFHNLTHLELHDSWDLVARVLQYFPKLQNLKLYQDIYGSIDNEEGEKWVDLEFVPECLLSSLRTCTMQDFSGLQGELALAKYILENAKNLKTMIIWCKSKSSKIQRKLSACLKASATCQLSVYIDPGLQKQLSLSW